MIFRANFGYVVIAVVAAAISLISSQTRAETLAKRATIAGMAFDYKVILPANYDAQKSYEAVLAFPGAGQNMRFVDSTLEANWRKEAESRGYIVISPAAPGGVLFFQGGEKVFPEFLDQILKDYNITGKKMHVAGVSNGGISAFLIAASYPQYFWSVTGFPGYLESATASRVKALRPLCVFTHVGENDEGWKSAMEEQAADLRAAGLSVEFTVEPGEGHIMRSLAGDGAKRLFEHFEKARRGCGG